MDRRDDLRAEWHQASERNRPHDAVKALVELEKLEPTEPRWSQRLGEAYRRAGRMSDAVDAFERAFLRYFDRGFLPHAIAMAKLVRSLDAQRGDLLEASLTAYEPRRPSLPVTSPQVPVTAEQVPFATGQGRASVVPKDVVKPPPLPTSDRPKPPRTSPQAQSVPVVASAEVTESPTSYGDSPPLNEPTRPGERPPSRGPVAALGASTTSTNRAHEPSTLPFVPVRAVRPAPLTRADDSSIDEVRFADAPDSSIEVLLVDFVSSEIVALDEDDLDPPTRPSGDFSPRSRDVPAVDTYATMATFRLFASLSRDALVALANAAELVEFAPGAMIIVRDERAFALYAIVSGTARVRITKTSADVRLKEGDVFGEASLLDEGQRQADVKAETSLMTLRIEKRALDEVTKEYPEVEDALFDLLARRLITNLMHTSPLFAAFEPAVRLELAQQFEVRRAPPGTIIAERGRKSDGLYVLLAGNVMAEPENEPAGRIARGTAFGYASLLGSEKADVTVRSVSEAVFLRMPAARFASLAALYPPALAHLADTVDEPLPMSRRDP